MATLDFTTFWYQDNLFCNGKLLYGVFTFLIEKFLNLSIQIVCSN